VPKTRIIATLGPASSTSTVLRKMMHAGLDVARLNFSHGTHAEHQTRIELIRHLNRKYRRHILLLGDLEGHRIRIGSLAKPIDLKKGQTLLLTQKEVTGSDTAVTFDYTGDLRDIKAGRYIYIDDGIIALKVEKSSTKAVRTKVVAGGMLKEHKGVNIPEVTLRFSGLSKQDREDIGFCLKHKLDYIAQSFVRTKGDILAVKALLGRNTSCKVIAKIENQEGISNIDEIIDVSDGIMVARGDLGVSLPIYQVPVIQKLS
jgi:pyruvate kinase